MPRPKKAPKTLSDGQISMLESLQSAQDRKEQAARELETLVCDAIESGLSQRQVATALGRTQPAISMTYQKIRNRQAD